jgi:hypothetical protein
VTKPLSRLPARRRVTADIAEGAVKSHPPASESWGPATAVSPGRSHVSRHYAQGEESADWERGEPGDSGEPLGCTSDSPEGARPIDNLVRFFAVLSRWSPEETALKAA